MLTNIKSESNAPFLTLVVRLPGLYPDSHRELAPDGGFPGVPGIHIDSVVVLEKNRSRTTIFKSILEQLRKIFDRTT